MARGKHAKQSNLGKTIGFVLLLVILAGLAFWGSQHLLPNQSNSGEIIAEEQTEDTGNLPEESIEADSEENDNPFGIDPTKPMIALTFDDGPSQYTWDIVKVLADNKARATFFEVGCRVTTHRDAIEYVLANHNEIASHSFDHKDLTKLSREDAWAQVENTDWIFWSEHDYYINLIRTPYGSENDTVQSVLVEKKHPNILWSVDTNDWQSKDKNAIANEILTNVQDGDIVLMHDIYAPTAEAVAIAVPQLVEQGYQLVTVSELMRFKGIDMEPGKTYRSGK